jgi:hypothetical protein
VFVVLTVGASDDAVKDALATSGEAYSFIVGSMSLTTVVLLKRKSPARDGIKQTCKISFVCEGCKGIAKFMGGACPHTRAAKRN